MGFLSMVKNMEKGKCHLLNFITMATGDSINQKVRVSFGLQILIIKEDLNLVLSIYKGNNFLKMVIFMKETIQTINLVDMVSIFGKILHFMKENSKTGSEMGKAYGNSVLSLLKEIM